MYCISYTRRGKKNSFKAKFCLVISTQKKHWGSLNPEKLSFEILQGMQDIQMGLAHTTNTIGDLCHSAGAAGADTKERAKRQQKGTLSFPGHHHPAISSHQWKSNLEYPAWALRTAEGSSEKRIQNVAVLGASAEPGAEEPQPFKGILRKICCNFWKAGILLFRNSINAMSVVLMCYLDLSMSCLLCCRAGGCFDYTVLCQILAQTVIVNSY